MLEYLAHVDFEGKQVVLIPTSGGMGRSGLGYFKNATIDADGVVLSTLQFRILEADAGESLYCWN